MLFVMRSCTSSDAAVPVLATFELNSHNHLHLSHLLVAAAAGVLI